LHQPDGEHADDRRRPGEAGSDQILATARHADGILRRRTHRLQPEQRLQVAKAKAAGEYRGRPQSINAAKVAELRSEGLGASEIARRLGIARASLYRLPALPITERRKIARSSTGAL
jgi:DNA invertase Pin-like site-specific DNA recombinase